MPPKKSSRISKRAKPRSPPSAQTDVPGSPNSPDQYGGPLPAKKRPAVAENAKAIHSMEAKVDNMALLLGKIAQNMCPDTEPILQAETSSPPARRFRRHASTPPGARRRTLFSTSPPSGADRQHGTTRIIVRSQHPASTGPMLTAMPTENHLPPPEPLDPPPRITARRTSLALSGAPTERRPRTPRPPARSSGPIGISPPRSNLSRTTLHYRPRWPHSSDQASATRPTLPVRNCFPTASSLVVLREPRLLLAISPFRSILQVLSGS